MSRPVKSIDDAFASEPDLKRRIYKAITIQPQNGPLFNDISNYVLSLQSVQRSSNGDPPSEVRDNDGPPAKKRKLDEPPTETAQQPQSNGPRRTILEAREISFTLPQRKKLHLGIVQYGSSLNDSKSTFAIQARNPTSNQVEFEYPTSSFAYALRLPVPEKNQKQYNFCLIPHPDNAATTEALIWTVNHGPLKSCKVDDPDLAKIAPGPEDVLENALGFVLEKTGLKLTFPSEDEFASAVRESHRKNDVTYHVKAHRGSKEGYLFFLENGIFFGFKKPLSFFPFNEIESISYTSVLQRTFNLNITIRPNPDADTQEIEYSMLDQQDFAGIDAYVKTHQLQDSSLADARRAKKAGKGKAAEANGDADDVRTELEKAEAELEDEEDELEEDYDPDEEGSDSGSGSDSDGEEYTKGKGRNLIAEELGSEAEDVSASEDELNEDNADGEDDLEEEEVEDEEMEDLPPKQVSVPTRAAKIDRFAPSIDDEDQL